MVGTKARWFAPSRVKPKADPPGRQRTPGGYGGRVYAPKPKTAKPPKSGGTGHWNERKRGPRPNRTVPGVPGYDGSYGPPPTPKEQPARPVSRQLRTFGKRVAGRYPVPRLRIPLFEAVNVAEALLAPNPSPSVPPVLPWNYAWCNGGWSFPNGYYPWVSNPWFGGLGSCDIALPRDSQAYAAPINWAGSPDRVYWRRQYRFGTIPRDYVAGTVVRIGPVLSPQPKPHNMIVEHHVMNPNLARWAPPEPGGQVRAKFKVGVGTPIQEPTAFANPELPYAPDFAWRWEFTPGQTVVEPILDFVAGPGPGTTNPNPGVEPPVKRKPPPEGEKQRKSIPFAKKVVIAIYKGLDVASEGAEIVDAVYDALPDSVKKRWKKAERMGDNFGQYGIDGADWKMRAIYHNADKIDVEQAFKNIIKNGLTDAVTGGIQSQLPKNSGAAHSHGEKEFNRLLDEWIEREYGF